MEPPCSYRWVFLEKIEVRSGKSPTRAGNAGVLRMTSRTTLHTSTSHGTGARWWHLIRSRLRISGSRREENLNRRARSVRVEHWIRELYPDLETNCSCRVTVRRWFQ